MTEQPNPVPLLPPSPLGRRRHKGEHMSGPQRAELIRELQALIVQGADDWQAKLAIAGKFRLRPATVSYYCAVAYRIWSKQANQRQDHKLARAIQRRMWVMRRASQEGDLDVFLKAADSEAKILGLFAPEKHEVLVHHINVMLADVVEVVREFLPDPAIRRSFTEALARRVDRRLREKPAAVGMIEGELVQPPTAAETPPQSELGSESGGNGRG